MKSNQEIIEDIIYKAECCECNSAAVFEREGLKALEAKDAEYKKKIDELNNWLTSDK